ncbi:glyoxalase superfamily protein [Roseovarius sp. ZX-A-9]|uniref:glyoxalase superfamily protein n=1 Tax=Roseovarius sp. ZX-A-9 TaxID=3014783 RepID=UPI00232AC546|nr:glyoxalase superfamily protein [Roseovarius sp. ZX-A-9]
MNTQLPSIAQAKDQAKHLRGKMTEDGAPIGHAKSLELVAHQHGFRDWNAMSAAIGNGPPKGWAVGEKVNGTYLSQPFKATVISITMDRPGWFRVGLELDEAVDVVTSDQFSNLRKRIRGVVGPKGHSAAKTSNGQPHLRIDL